MLAASLALSVNGVDSVATKRILSWSVGRKNNLLLNVGFYPGSGLKKGLQVRGRMEIGACRRSSSRRGCRLDSPNTPRW